MKKVLILFCLSQLLVLSKVVGQTPRNFTKSDSLEIEEIFIKFDTYLSNNANKKMLEIIPELLEKEELKSEKDLQSAYLFYKVGVSYNVNFQHQKAAEYALITLNIFKELGLENDVKAIPIYNLFSLLEGQKNNFKSSIDYQEQALRILLENGAQATLNLGVTYNNLGISHTYLPAQDRFKRALFYFNKAKSTFYQLPGYFFEKIYVHTNIGDMYLQLGRNSEAENELHKAILIQKNNPSISETSILNTYDLLGQLKVQENNFEQAIKYFNTCKMIQEKYGHQPNYPSLLNYISQLNIEIGDTLEANHLYYESLKVLNVINYDIRAVDPQVMTILYNVLFSRLEFLKDVYTSKRDVNTKDSILFLTDKILEVQEEIENNTLSKNNRQVLNTYAFSAYSDAIETYYDHSDDLNKIFKVIELTKSKFIFQFGNQFQDNTLKGFTQDRAEEKRLKANINQLEVAIYNQENRKVTSEVNVESLKDSLFKQKVDLQAVLEKIKEEYPESFQLNMEETILTLDAIQRHLQSDECVLEYFIGEEAIFIFVISKKGIQIEKVKKDFPLEDLVNQMREGIYDYWVLPGQPDKVLNEKSKAYVEAAHQLYLKLISPVESYLSRKVLIIPDAILNLLPFDALLKEMPEHPNDFQNFSYLIKEYNIYYDYAASLHWKELARNKKRNKKSIAVFAPQFKQSNASITSNTRTVRSIREDLGYLEYNDEEANRLLELLQGDKYGESLASKQSFLDNASDYNILHLATHGKASDQLGDYSFIAFAEGTNDSVQNNLLYVRELYELDLNADLVVLSACETGIGEFRRGEGIISVAKGFSYAGARSTVTTLWNIYDHPATVGLMENFYKNLKEGKRKDEALRNAKLASLANPATASPYFWAGFIPIGDMAPISTNDRQWWAYMLISVLVLVLIGYYLQNRRATS